MIESKSLDSRPDEPTVARLLEERLLRRARVVSGDEHLDRLIRWCHSFQDAVVDGSANLSDVAVLVDSYELDARTWPALLRSGCAAIFLRGDSVPRVPPAEGAQVPVVVAIPSTVTRRSVVELVAMLSLAHQTHVLRYGQRVHETLAQLLHRGAGLTALCTRLARLSECGVAVLDVDLHLLAFDPGPGSDLDPHSVTSALQAVPDRLEAVAANAAQSHGVGVQPLGAAHR